MYIRHEGGASWDGIIPEMGILYRGGNCYGSSMPLNFSYPGDGPPSPLFCEAWRLPEIYGGGALQTALATVAQTLSRLQESTARRPRVDDIESPTRSFSVVLLPFMHVVSPYTSSPFPSGCHSQLDRYGGVFRWTRPSNGGNPRPRPYGINYAHGALPASVLWTWTLIRKPSAGKGAVGNLLASNRLLSRVMAVVLVVFYNSITRAPANG
jgi:hypothetical protein